MRRGVYLERDRRPSAQGRLALSPASSAELGLLVGG